MNDGDRHPEPQEPYEGDPLDRYLDGLLSDAEAAAFADGLSSDAPLQAVVDKQASIDASLRKSFAAPDVDAGFLAQLAADAADGPAAEMPVEELATPSSIADGRAAYNRRMRWVAAVLAVACALVVAVQWDTYKELVFGKSRDGYNERMVAQIYDGAVAAGFKPDWFCEDDKRFAETFAERQGVGLLLKPLPDGVRMTGLAYLNGFTENATSMLAEVDGQPVLVLVARSREVNQDLLHEGERNGVTLFTRELDDLLLIEATPLDEPRVLDSLFRAEVPREPTGHVPGTPY